MTLERMDNILRQPVRGEAAGRKEGSLGSGEAGKPGHWTTGKARPYGREYEEIAMPKTCGSAVALLLSLAVPVRAQVACSLVQITSTSGATTFNLNAAIDAVGSRIAFESSANFLGTNPDGNLEIVLWDALTGFVQITGTSGGQSLNPAINAAGNRVAFESNADPLGSNGDANFEIFLWDSSTGLTQITNSASGDSRSPAIDAIGNRIAFASSSDLVGSNGDGSMEIFLWDSSAGLTQITDTAAGRLSSSPSINAAGNRIAFVSNANLTGGNGDANVEVFLWDASTGITQITDTSPLTGNHGHPVINAAGDRIAFEFGFPSQIFLWDASAGITPVSAGLSAPSVLPSISAAGTRVAFRSNEIFVWDASTGLTQVTTTPGGTSDAPAIDAVGNRIAFHSDGDLLGTNADGNNELFLAACPLLAVAEIPAVSPAGLLALAALLGLAAAWTLRRRMTELR